MDLTRRSFIRWTISAGAALACPVPLNAAIQEKGGGPGTGVVGGQTGPAGIPAGQLHSEDRTVCHQVRDGEAFAVPPPSRRVDVAVIGGGPSGLAAADEIKGADFLLLEKEGHVGGNAYAESWGGLNYSTGASWDTASDPDFAGLARRWNFAWKPIKGDDAAYCDGVWINPIWTGKPDNPAIERLPYSESVKDSFRRFIEDHQGIDIEKNKQKLDAMPFSDILKGYAPQIKAFWDYFGPSNWGAPTELTSAYLGLEAAIQWFRDQRYTWEGGIGMASKTVYDGLPERARKNIWTGAYVYKVRRKGKKAWVSFFHDGKPQTVEARAVVMAVPKFIAKFLVEDLPADQRQAMAGMRYAPYLVYNLCFDRVVYNQAYDNWVIGAKNLTDFIPADFVTHADGGDLRRKQVITVYAPRPESERADIQDDAKVLAQAQAGTEELIKIFPGWQDHLAEVRIFRRGHPLPMSIPGYYTKLQPLARRDLPPIYFAHCDAMGEVSDFFYAALSGIAAAKKALKHV